jgi:sugar O-acyltransferase (sialic acid O-acetyltransferase NeuD family)
MSAGREVYVVGGGGHAKVVVSTLLAAGYEVEAALDDDAGAHGTRLLGVPVIGPVDELKRLGPVRAVLAIGGNRIRKKLSHRFGKVEWMSVVHPRATVHPSVRIGAGTVVFAGAIIQPDTIIGAHAIINTGATVDHDCVVGDYVHIAPGGHVAGGVRLDEGVLLGIGSAVAPGVRVGSWTTVGAGGVAVRDLPAGVTAVGVPVRILNKKGVVDE